VDIGGRFGSGGLGSGVIYRQDGYIVTNAHVVDDADEVEVHLNSGETLSARVVGTAAPTVDIAVLKVDHGGLPAATFGASRTLELGELAVVIGSPFGLDTTVTSGVISGLHRNLNLGDGIRFTDGIQTDAPLNPGNSGGALANSRGEVVGINTATVGAGGGVGFAIPIEIVRKVADQIIQTGRAQLAFIGIAGDNLTIGRGARIREVVSGGPADDAGLRPDDVVVEFDGKKVESMDDLVSMLIDKDVDDVVRVTYERDGKRQDASVKLAARPGR
jgi:S1-C subfamily serine protease